MIDDDAQKKGSHGVCDPVGGIVKTKDLILLFCWVLIFVRIKGVAEFY